MSLLEVKNMSVRYGALTIVDGVSFSLNEGQWLMVIGPNGAGKSTIVNAVSQGAPYSGEVRLLDKDIKTYRPHKLARTIGVLSQSYYVGYSFSVEEVVRLGRYAHAPGIFSHKSDEDDNKVQEAMAMTGMLPFAKQSVLTLSGGELQRTFLAQLFAQDPRILILDEPTNHLDLIHQRQTFALIQEWLRGEGRAVISVVHDLSLAKAFGTHALLLNKGKAVAAGKTQDVYDALYLDQAYSMDVYAWMRMMLSQWQNEG